MKGRGGFECDMPACVCWKREEEVIRRLPFWLLKAGVLTNELNTSSCQHDTNGPKQESERVREAYRLNKLESEINKSAGACLDFSGDSSELKLHGNKYFYLVWIPHRLEKALGMTNGKINVKNGSVITVIIQLKYRAYPTMSWPFTSGNISKIENFIKQRQTRPLSAAATLVYLYMWREDAKNFTLNHMTLRQMLN